MTALLPELDAAPARAELDLPLVVTTLMRGVLYRESSPEVWRHLTALQSDLRDHVAVLGLVPVVDEREGYAFLRQRPEDPGTERPLPGWSPAGRCPSRSACCWPCSAASWSWPTPATVAGWC
ncbi:DUF4194 domain-containing protein [Klenkia terrae]|uniref:DUF4194 domain-containing protein n=1 Tax=Klenkia terrae TaxID=1052259 RepID=UPI00360C24E4